MIMVIAYANALASGSYQLPLGLSSWFPPLIKGTFADSNFVCSLSFDPKPRIFQDLDAYPEWGPFSLPESFSEAICF